MTFTYRISVLEVELSGGGFLEIATRAAEGQGLCTKTTSEVISDVTCTRLAAAEKTPCPGPSDLAICLGAACGVACREELSAEGRFLLVAGTREEESALLDLQEELERAGFRGKALSACPEAGPLYALGGALEELCAAGLFTLEELAEEAVRDAPDQAQARLSALERGMSTAPLHRCKGQISR